MKRLNFSICILLILMLIIAGCNNRIYQYNPDPTQISQTISPITTETPTETTTEETTTEEPTTEETTTEEPTSPPPSPYELILASNPLNEAGNIFFIDSNITFSDTTAILSFFEWLDGAVFAIIDYSTEEVRIFYMDPISQEIYSSLTFTAPEFTISIYTGPNNTLVIADTVNSCFSIYDKDFNLLNKFSTPDSVSFTSFPIMSSDLNFAYYSDEAGLTCYKIDLTTGISSPVITSDSNEISRTPSCIITDGTREVLLISVYSNLTFESTHEYYDTATFELIKQDNYAYFEQCAKGNNKYIGILNDVVEHIIYLPELNKDSVKEIYFDSQNERYSSWFAAENLLFTFYNVEVSDTANSNYGRFSAYNLDTGLCAYKTDVDFNGDGSFGGYITHVIYNEELNAIIGIHINTSYEFFLWDLNNENSKSLDETIYIGKFFAPGEIDWEQLNKLKKEAKELSIKYGVHIAIGDDTRTDTGDYIATQILQPAIIRNAMSTLDKALSRYPKDFFYQLQNEDGVPLEINLTGTISPVDGYDSISNAIGLHNYNLGTQYIILDINNLYLLETTIYHEIFHAMDWFVTYNSIWFDSDWLALNPENFEYDYGYISNEGNNDTTYLYYTEEGYFIDIYSKSYPNEDRARIFENAMAGYEYYFESEGLYNKLSYICLALREVFDSSTWEETTSWEAALLPMKEYYGNIPPEAAPETN